MHPSYSVEWDLDLVACAASSQRARSAFGPLPITTPPPTFDGLLPDVPSSLPHPMHNAFTQVRECKSGNCRAAGDAHPVTLQASKVPSAGRPAVLHVIGIQSCPVGLPSASCGSLRTMAQGLHPSLDNAALSFHGAQPPAGSHLRSSYEQRHDEVCRAFMPLVTPYVFLMTDPAHVCCAVLCCSCMLSLLRPMLGSRQPLHAVAGPRHVPYVRHRPANIDASGAPGNRRICAAARPSTLAEHALW